MRVRDTTQEINEHNKARKLLHDELNSAEEE